MATSYFQCVEGLKWAHILFSYPPSMLGKNPESPNILDDLSFADELFSSATFIPPRLPTPLEARAGGSDRGPGLYSLGRWVNSMTNAANLPVQEERRY